MEDRLLENFVEKLLAIGSEPEMIAFLQSMFTPKELVEIPRRLEIVKLLKRGLPQREIADQLGVGIATVTRGSRELQLGRFDNV